MKTLTTILVLFLAVGLARAAPPTGGPRLSPPSPVTVISDLDPIIPLVLGNIGVSPSNGWTLNFVDLTGTSYHTHMYSTWIGSSGEWANSDSESVFGSHMIGINFAVEFAYSSLGDDLIPYLRWFQVVQSNDQTVA